MGASKSLPAVVKPKMVLIVRTDVKMSPGKIAAQCAHAAVTLYESGTKSRQTPFLKLWLILGQPKIVLRVDSNCESALKNVYSAARHKNLNACLIYDAGKTQVPTGTLTVVGVGPNNSSDVDEITKKFKLL